MCETPDLSPRPAWAQLHTDPASGEPCELCGAALTIFTQWQDPENGYAALCEGCYWTRPSRREKTV